MRKAPISGRHCPACGEDVGWAAGLKSLWPMTLTCPYCDRDLAYVDTRNVIIAIVLAAVVLCFASYSLAASFVPIALSLFRIALTVFFMMLFWLVIGALAGRYLRSHKLLALRVDGNKKR